MQRNTNKKAVKTLTSAEVTDQGAGKDTDELKEMRIKITWAELNWQRVEDELAEQVETTNALRRQLDSSTREILSARAQQKKDKEKIARLELKIQRARENLR